METAAVSSPSVEVSLRSAGRTGLTVQQLVEATGKSETSVRRVVSTLVDGGEAHKQATFDGAKVVWGPKPAQVPTDPALVNPRRRAAAERDARVLEALKVNGRISLNELARILEMPDIDGDGWSQLAYLSIRRLQKKGRVEREIVWVHKDDPTTPKT